ncbi:DNA polymerase III subunit delta' [Hyphomicrobium sp. NDB2Meth4]|uniref:DNA polymerase III subunit delta' n=1 Tax=Hyphomicrobium sp. NDB2Meth4 TaxID=1892846 RepID=UPI000930D42B|nr:DNA polymerase III subunit delta' [Hyphomicrobium sp. NDB2Meth4]
MARAPAITEIEELPEADRLGDFPHPRHTRALFGQGDAERALAEALASGRMHHAWLLAGPKGIGKATLAYRFARAALAQPQERDPTGHSLDVDDATIAARQVRALSHPGLLVVRRPYDTKGKRFASSIPVDEVRRLRTFLGHRAAGDGWRVVIVDEANELNVNAANALLKSLEEPPERTVFLLVSPAPGDLVPTIRSRCRMLSLSPLSDSDLRAAATAALAAADMPPPADADWAPLERLSGGSVARLLGLFGTGGLALQAQIDRLLGLLPRVDWKAVHALSDELQPVAAQPKFELYFELLMGTLAHLIRLAATGEGSPEDQSLAAKLIGTGRLASFAALWERVAREKADTLALNLDRKSLIIQTVAALSAAAQDRKPD